MSAPRAARSSAASRSSTEAWLREAIRVHPSDYPTRYALVQCLRQKRKDAEAKQEEEQAEKVKERRERRMDQRLVIDSLVGLRALRVAIDDQHLTEHGAADDGHVLERGTSREVRLLDRVLMQLRRRELLDIPLPMFGFGQRERLSTECDGRPARLGTPARPRSA